MEAGRGPYSPLCSVLEKWEGPQCLAPGVKDTSTTVLCTQLRGTSQARDVSTRLGLHTGSWKGRSGGQGRGAGRGAGHLCVCLWSGGWRTARTPEHPGTRGRCPLGKIGKGPAGRLGHPVPHGTQASLRVIWRQSGGPAPSARSSAVIVGWCARPHQVRSAQPRALRAARIRSRGAQGPGRGLCARAASSGYKAGTRALRGHHAFRQHQFLFASCSGPPASSLLAMDPNCSCPTGKDPRLGPQNSPLPGTGQRGLGMEEGAF